MSYGFQATNDNNQVLISSETKNLHFIQKLTGPRNTTVSASDPDAGIIYSTNINGGIRRWRYTATCANTPVPFFTMPTNDFYGILRIVNKNNSRWDIEILRSGTSPTVPELYIFSDPGLPFTLTHTGTSAYETAFTAAQQSSGRLVPLRAYPDSEYLLYKYTFYSGGFFGSWLESARQGSMVPLQDFTAMTQLTGTVVGNLTPTVRYYTVSLPWNISFGTRDNINMFYIGSSSAVTFDTPNSNVLTLRVPFNGYSTPNLDDVIALSSHPRWIFDNAANTAEINKAGVWVTTTGTAPNRRFYIRARFHDVIALTASNNLPPALSWQIMLQENDPGKQWIHFGQNYNYTWPENFPKAYIYKDTTEYGMVVYRDDGSPSFDSRLKPLTVNGAVTVTHPSPPRASFSFVNRTYAPFCGASGLDNAGYFLPNVANSYSITTTGSFPTKPIYSFLSIAQSNVEIYSYDDQGYLDYNSNPFTGYEYNHDYWQSWYWHFYRGGIKQEVTATGLPNISTDTAMVAGALPYNAHTTNDSSFYNSGGAGSWAQPTTRSGDDGLWFFQLPWDIYFTNREGTGVVPYNHYILSTNGYITFNYYNYSTATFRDPFDGTASFAYTGLATASTLSMARIMIYAADNSAYRFYEEYSGTAPNRVYRTRYTGYPTSSGWESYATIAPSLVWEVQYYENKPDEIHITFPTSTIDVHYGAVLGVGTAQGWQSISIEPTASTITPKNLVIKKGRVAADYAANPVVKAGWASHDFGCHYYFQNSAGFFSGISNNSGGGGTWPYTNETINLSNNAIILADGSKYDG
jgi:hypothetical protein